jgi:hypothetical protein
MKKSFIYIIDWTSTLSAIKIGKADNIYSRYSQLKSNFGEADLTNSYWIEVPVSKVNDIEKLIHLRLKRYRKEISVKSDGSTEFFDINSFESLKELCEDMDLTIQKGISEPKKKNKRIMTYAEQQQKAKENIEKSIRKDQRTLKRLITIFKYLNQEENNFKIKYLKPNEKALIRGHYENSSPKRWINSFIIFPEKKVKAKFLEWLQRKSWLDRSYGIGTEKLFFFNLYFDQSDDEYITRIFYVEDFLTNFKKLRASEKNDNPKQYDYTQKYLLPYFDELIFQIEKFLEKRQADFNTENWLHPNYEWQNNGNENGGSEIFNLQKPSKRIIKVNLEPEKIESIIVNRDNWVLKLKDKESEILISRLVMEDNSFSHANLFYFADEDNYFKFLHFLNDLFIKDTQIIKEIETIIYYPKSIKNKIYSIDDLV